MNNHEVLSEGIVVKILRSANCECVNVIFGNFGLHLTPCSLNCFITALENVKKNINSAEMNPYELISIPTPYQGIYLFFVYNELVDTIEVCHEAVAMLELYELLRS